MKPITISRRSRFLNKLLQQAVQQNIILQSVDGEQFVLARISSNQPENASVYSEIQAFIVGESEDFDEEVAATRQNAELMAFLDERAAHATPGKNTSLETIRQRLGE